MNALYKKKRPLIAFVLTTVVGLGVIGNVNQVVAATSQVNLAVTANVATKCKLNTPVDVAFGTYDPVEVNASAALDANGAFNIQCTKNSVGTIAIDDGAHYSAPNRRMSDGGSVYLVYDLYTTAGRTVVWNSSNTVSYSATNASPFTETVYGRIPGGQVDAIAGSYTDTVTVTVTY